MAGDGMTRCAGCRRPIEGDRAYCWRCLTPGEHAVSAYTDFTRPILEDEAKIERRFAAAKAHFRATLHVGDGWQQRSAPPVGSRLTDYAPLPGDLPTHHEVVGTPSECPVKRKAARAARKQIAHEWNSGVGR